MTMPLAILAGGKGTRLYPLTGSIPKSLVLLDGVPFICRQLNYFGRQGIRRIIICVGWMGEQIQNVVGDGNQFGVEVEYSADGPVPSGTAGALRRALPLLGQEFLVTYGDSIVQAKLDVLKERFERCATLGMMTVFKNCDRWVPSNVDYRRGSVVAYGVPSNCGRFKYVDYGLIALRSEAIRKYSSPGKLDLGAVLADLASRGALAGMRVTRRFYEIGSFVGLREAQTRIGRLAEWQ